MSRTEVQPDDRSSMVDVYCGQCGIDRSGDMTLTNAKRTPSVPCGATSLQYRRQFMAVASVSASVSTALTPGKQERDWLLRWEQIKQRAADLSPSKTAPRSATAIHAAAQEFIDFYVFAYHLKDRLIAEQVQPKQVIESAISAEPTLSLLADLANLDKHFVLTKPPRSGDTPIIHVSDASSGPTWTLVMKIGHHGASLDGFPVAADAVATWDRLLRHWGAIT